MLDTAGRSRTLPNAPEHFLMLQDTPLHNQAHIIILLSYYRQNIILISYHRQNIIHYTSLTEHCTLSVIILIDRTLYIIFHRVETESNLKEPYVSLIVGKTVWATALLFIIVYS